MNPASIIQPTTLLPNGPEDWLSNMPSMGGSFDEDTQMMLGPSQTPRRAASSHDDMMTSMILLASDDQSATEASKDLPTNDAPRKRRGHTKSRLGCISCKKRKIKCQETWPSCANCIKRGCPCRYPTVFKPVHLDRHESETPAAPRLCVKVSDTPTMYSANDLRLFHHFLIAAHPCIPQEHEDVWIREVPAYSHRYEYLMHSLLAVSGSHLGLFVDGPNSKLALSHRQKAIKGLEDAFSRWPPKDDEVHIMLATSYLLGFQSAYMPDGFIDHILSFRGCAVLSKFILDNHVSGMFNVDPNMHNKWLELRLRNFPILDQGLAQDGLRSLANVAPRLSKAPASEIDRTIFAQLVECIRPLLLPSRSASPSPSELQLRVSDRRTASNSSSALISHINNPILPGEVAASYDELMSNDMELITDVTPDYTPQPLRAFNALMSSVLVLTTYPQDQVLNFLSLSHNVSNVVLAHFVAVRFIVAPLSAPQAAMGTPIEAMIEWCEHIIQAVDDDEDAKWTQYVEWPRRILATMRSCANQKRGLTFGDLYNILTKEPAAFRE